MQIKPLFLAAALVSVLSLSSPARDGLQLKLSSGGLSYPTFA